MPTLVEMALANAVVAAVLALVALAVGRVCRRPAIMHALWLLVLLKLVTPPLFRIPLPVLPAETAAPIAIAAAPMAPAMTPAPTTGQYLVLPGASENELLIGVKVDAPTTPAEIIVPDQPAVMPAIASSATGMTACKWTQGAWWLGGVWLAGAVAWFGCSICRMMRFSRLLAAGTPAPPWLVQRSRQIACDLGVTDCPNIWLVPGLVPPLLWKALGKPCVYLPCQLLASLQPDERDALLAHELAHLLRRDHWVRWLEFIVQGAFWWNPLVPMARTRLQRYEEECCDALVVGVVPARSYALALVHTLDFLANAVPAPATASGVRKTSPLHQRLTDIMTGDRAGQLGFTSRFVFALAVLGLMPLMPWFTRSEARVASTPVDAMEPAATFTPTSDDDPPSTVDVSFEVPASGTPRAMACSPNGLQMAIGLENHTIEIHDPATGKTLRTLSGHTGPVNCVVFSPDGLTIATGSSDRTVRLWESSTGRPKATLRGHGHWVYALAFSPDGRTLASGAYDRTIRLWNSSTCRLEATLRGHESAVRCLAFTPDGKTLASGSGDRTIRLWSTRGRTTTSVLTGHVDTVRVLAYSADGRALASGGDDGVLRVWDTATGELRTALPGHRGEITTLAFSPWSQVLVTGSLDRTIRWWDLRSPRSLAVIPGSSDGVIGLAFAPDGVRLTSLGLDRQVRHMPLARAQVRIEAAPAPNQAMMALRKVQASRTSIQRAWVQKAVSGTELESSDEAPRILIVEIIRQP